MLNRSALALAAVSLSFASANAQERDQKFTLPHITVTGTSFAEIKPDIATFTLGVVSENPTAAEAELENAKAAASVIAQLKELAVDPKDIKTSSLILAPVMVDERDPKNQWRRQTHSDRISRGERPYRDDPRCRQGRRHCLPRRGERREFLSRPIF